MKRLESLKDNLIKNKILIENFTFLSALQVSNLILFLITVPYLFRILGSRNYGLIIFAQTIAFYFSIFVNFGFNLTATRDISVNRNDKNKISEIFSSVLVLKVVFFLISFLSIMILISCIESLKVNRNLYIFSMLACLSEALFPLWFFQGIEKMKYITFFNVSTRILATILVFVFIDNQQKYFLYPLIIGSGALAGSLGALTIVLKRYRVRFIFQPVKVYMAYFKENLLYFFSNISTQIYVNANKIIIGSFLGMVSLAYYDVAEKVINMVKVPYSLLGQTLFPRVARDRNMRFINKVMLVNVIYTVFLITGIYFLSDILIAFLSGSSNPETVNILRILSLSLLPISISLFYGDLLLINLNLKIEYAKMRFAGLVFYLAIFFGLYFFKNISTISVALTVLIVEVFLSFYSYVLCRKAIVCH
jgi:O-antigen/teichoic acid export membrane protein